MTLTHTIHGDHSSTIITVEYYILTGAVELQSVEVKDQLSGVTTSLPSDVVDEIEPRLLAMADWDEVYAETEEIELENGTAH